MIRSGFIPKIFGVLLIVACFAYLGESITSIVFPGATHVVSTITTPLGGLGELMIVLWLLIKGGDARPGEAVPT